VINQEHCGGRIVYLSTEGLKVFLPSHLSPPVTRSRWDRFWAVLPTSAGPSGSSLCPHWPRKGWKTWNLSTSSFTTFS